MYNESVKCPNCLQDNDLEELEQNTEYGCWSGEYVNVSCLRCDFYFEVTCEHRGYEARTDFDLTGFMQAHGLYEKLPRDNKNISGVFVRHYLEDFVMNGTSKAVENKDPRHADAWKESFVLAKQLWEEVKAKIEKKREAS